MSHLDPNKTASALFSALHERSKELGCLYTIEEILSNYSLALEEVFRRVIAAIPPGWQFPKVCQARIVHGSDVYESAEYVETPFLQSADIYVQDAVVGRLHVSYSEPTPEADCGPFLHGETKLIQTIAERLGHFILHQRLRLMFEEMSGVRREAAEAKKNWRIALDLLSNTDQSLFLRISRKMMNHLGWRGVGEARSLLLRHGENQGGEALFGEANRPQEKESLDRLFKLSEETFKIAAVNLTDDEILGLVQKWINEDRSSAAVKALEDVYASLNEVLDAMRRFKLLLPQGVKLSRAKAASVRVALIRRFFTEQLEYINILKKYVDLEDFFDMMGRIIFPPDSRGKLGGKSAGLFLASRVLRQAARRVQALGTVKKPKTWYLTSDCVIHFLRHNNLEDVIEQKYKDIDEVRLEYPHLVQVFKNCAFPPEIVKGLSVALDDFGEQPIIVRSSSLLEDRMGTAFAGKYKSLFLANQGDKKKRLDALLDAVAEVYASTFNPDAIQYRAERGLLDFHEEMGIMIQAVVGKRVGRYFFPAFAGVAFSRNEFRWSARIRREDGLLRLVPGLGTRAVDRLSDDYPVLVAPGRPNLKVNVTQEEMIRYSPKRIDVLDLEDNCFTTRDIRDLLKEVGQDYPALDKIISISRDGLLHPPLGLVTDFDKEDLVVTFEGLVGGGEFMRRLVSILKTLESALGIPVDVEFAFDGEDFYLLQCRPQSQSVEESAMEIPAGLSGESVLFTADRFVSNGRVADISHVVYVEPDRYGEIASLEDLTAVGRAVGKLNKLLPRRRFLLMGPGRWGSRGDIKLGVRVTYADISNAAMLIEVARKKGNYVPDVSFGTHFFQDLVESGIRYLPLYPDDPQIQFNDAFLKSAPNLLSKILPEHKKLADTIRLIDVSQSTGGKALHVLMNADQEKAVAYFAEPGASSRAVAAAGLASVRDPGEPSRWRRRMAERIARLCEAPRRGVKAVYLLGGAAVDLDGPDGEINLIVHFEGNAEQRKELEAWLEAWNSALTEMNHFRTGVRLEPLLVCRFVGSEAADKKSVAAALDLPEETLLELPLGNPPARRRRQTGFPTDS